MQATQFASTGLGTDPLRGNVVPVHDPSLAFAGGSWYAFTTDLPFLHASTHLAIRCSPDARGWRLCGHVFDQLPGWVRQEVPEAKGLWAPQVAYFSGVYHLYYAASSMGSQRSGIGLATNTTLDPLAAEYHWVDQGEVLGSHPGDTFNAIDPAAFVDRGAGGGTPEVWLSFGSFWGGIKQRRLDPATGKLDPRDGSIYSLAARPYDPHHAIEGASMAAHDGWYYLFASRGRCCEIPIQRDTYQQIAGRSRSVHGPFLGEDGSRMLDGGGTLLLDSNSEWLAPGGGRLYQQEGSGQTYFAFHALKRAENGALYLWVKQVAWQAGWPVLRDP